MGSNKKIVVSIITAIIFLGIGAVLLMSASSPGEHERVIPSEQNVPLEYEKQTNPNQDQAEHTTDRTSTSSGSQRATSAKPGFANLKLPFNTSDISLTGGEINPLGVVRFNKDQPEFGHSGIDIPLNQGAPIYAVADGTIVIVKSASDPWGGQGIFQLLEQTGSGEGWVYIYEHITPTTGIKEGSVIKRGDLIATKTAPSAFTAHFQMSLAFNNFEFTRGMVCWVDFLDAPASSELTGWWNERRTTAKLLDAWRTNDEEGKFPFRGLLDTTHYPDGPQLCYPPGTDVR